MDISLSGVNEKLMRVFKRTYLLEKIGLNHIFPTMELAICSVHDQSHHEMDESVCPLTTTCRIILEEKN